VATKNASAGGMAVFTGCMGVANESAAGLSGSLHTRDSTGGFGGMTNVFWPVSAFTITNS
jgi:hypothetical protein